MTFANAVEESPRKSTTVITADGLPLMTRRQLVPFLNANGIPIMWSTLNKLCAPRVGQGPPVAAYWGNKKLYAPQPSLDWARSKLSDQSYIIKAARSGGSTARLKKEKPRGDATRTRGRKAELL